MLDAVGLPSSTIQDAIVLLQVLLIDLTLAGDNAVAVGLAASGLTPKQRRMAILSGLGAAVALRICFALLATRILQVIGLTFAGGLILLWVCWKMWRDLRAAHHAEAETAPGVRPAKSFAGALLQIMLADLSMSLDNVLAVAGAARQHPALLAFGLIVSIALMGIAASWIAKVLNRVRWIGYVGLLVVVYVALHMIWDGHRGLVIDMDRTAQYNAIAPKALQITPADVAEHKAERAGGHAKGQH
jgi:YjbE family integral membrane protein